MDLHRYSLGLAVVEGDRPARGILGDLLEEQGERGLAQWARRCGPNQRARLELGIMLLPCEVSLDVGREFLEWSCREIAAWAELKDFLAVYAHFKADRESARSFDKTRAELNEAIPKLQPVYDPWTRNYRRDAPAHWQQQAVRRGFEAFGAAMQCVHNFRLSQRDDGDGKTYHWQLTANQHIREVSQSLHVQADDQVAWQFDAVVETYRKLLSA